MRVTRLGLGGAPLSGMVLANGLYGGTGRDEAIQIVQRAYDLGIRYFDTAPHYGNGRSEARYGAVLANLPRESFVVSTKVSRVLDPVRPGDLSPNEDGIPNFKGVFDFSRDGIFRAFEESLNRLKLDHVEIIYLHDADQYNGDGKSEALQTALPAMIELREQGAVKAIGAGMNEWQMPAAFIRNFDLDVILLAGRFTLLDHDAYPEFLPLCQQRGVKIVVGGPYNSGILARDLDQPVSFNYAPAAKEWIDRARALKAVCDSHGVPLKAAALQYPLAHPVIASVIPGAQSIAELEDNVEMSQVAIPPALWSDLKSQQLIPTDAKVPA